ncbi:MAG: hypothetical protein U9R25_02505 [Chloroflexota bacterium]|nr:hypothetical protein [Chloroflexota bacterium]
MSLLILICLPFLVAGAILVGLLLMTRIMPGDPSKAKTAAPVVQPVPARGPEYMALAGERGKTYRRGFIVLLALAALTMLEFAVAIYTGSLVPLFIIALGKAALILQYFMHFSSIWSEEAH